MLEGLEISEVNYSKIEIENRYDSEYYKQIFLLAEEYLISKNHFKLGEKYKITDGEHGSVEIQENGIKYLTAENIKKGYVDISKIRYVNNEVDERNARARVAVGDILISIKGTLGEIAVAEDWLLPANMNRDVAIVKPLLDELPSEYVALFMMSEYGALQSLRGGSGGVQQMITLERLRKFIIPTLSNDFSNNIKSLYNKAKSYRIESKNQYLKAETLLLETLNLKDFQLSKEPVNIKNFSESFGSSGRLDAEYYQVKYEQVVNRIISTDYNQLVNIVKIKKSIEPGSSVYADEGLPFVRVSDYNKFGLSTPDKYLTDDFCKENAEQIKKIKPKKETILFSKDGSVGTAYMLREDADFITSGAILHLTVKDKNKIIPEYLTLALNSKLVQMQAERDAGGSIILHWRVSEIEKVVVPIIDFDKQREIADLVEESFQLKKQSEHLLEVAKTAVEMAIEQNEGTAMEYINNQIS